MVGSRFCFETLLEATIFACERISEGYSYVDIETRVECRSRMYFYQYDVHWK